MQVTSKKGLELVFKVLVFVFVFGDGFAFVSRGDRRHGIENGGGGGAFSEDEIGKKRTGGSYDDVGVGDVDVKGRMGRCECWNLPASGGRDVTG